MKETKTTLVCDSCGNKIPWPEYERELPLGWIRVSADAKHRRPTTMQERERSCCIPASKDIEERRPFNGEFCSIKCFKKAVREWTSRFKEEVQEAPNDGARRE